jgi:hypothetical protein
MLRLDGVLNDIHQLARYKQRDTEQIERCAKSVFFGTNGRKQILQR